MVSLRKTRHIIQAPSGTQFSAIKPKLQKKSTLKPLKHQMVFGGRVYRYLVPNDGFDYFLYQSNRTNGVRACTVQERLDNEELVVKDVLDFGEKEIFCQKDEKLEKERKEKDKEISELVKEISHKKKKKLNRECKEKDQGVVRDTSDFKEEEDFFHKKGKKLKEELQEKDKEIAVLTKRIKVFSRENETLQKMLLQSLEKQVRKVRNEHFKRFQEEFGCKRKGSEVAQD